MSSSSGQRNITVNQAERIFDYDMAYKDFWYVSDTKDNHDLLQDVLDVLFNCTEGQNYEARYAHSAAYSRLVVYCGVCQKDLASYDPFVSHDSGKSHKRALNMLVDLKERVAAPVNFIFLNPSDPLNIFKEGTFEDRIDRTDRPVAGLQFVYKEKLDVDNTLHFTCQLCKKFEKAVRISDDEMYYHVTSPFHLSRFMDKVYDIRERDYETLLPLVKKHMKRNGRLTHEIIEFEWNAYPDDFSERHMRRKRSISPDLPPGKINKEGSSSKVVSTCDVGCQTDIPTRDINDFISELKFCSQAEEEMTSLLKDATPSEQDVLTKTVKIFSDALKGYCDDNDDDNDDEFNSLISTFNKLTSIL